MIIILIGKSREKLSQDIKDNPDIQLWDENATKRAREISSDVQWVVYSKQMPIAAVNAAKRLMRPEDPRLTEVADFEGILSFINSLPPPATVLILGLHRSALPTVYENLLKKFPVEFRSSEAAAKNTFLSGGIETVIYFKGFDPELKTLFSGEAQTRGIRTCRAVNLTNLVEIVENLFEPAKK